MTALREKAIGMVKQIPEDQIAYIIAFLEKVESKHNTSNAPQKSKAELAYNNLEKYFGRIEEPIDIKSELAEALTEKYESIS